jgi:CRISPR type IV-associated protein Csf1
MALEILTASQFIRQAALKTPRVETTMGKMIEYQDAQLTPTKDDKCWLCGGETGGQGQPTKKAIKPTFTDIDRARCSTSQTICSGCAFCLSRSELRNYSILATTEGLRHPARAEIRDLLLEPPEPPFVLCIAVSGQKWVHFKSHVAYSQDGYPVQMEETRIYVDRGELRKILGLVERLYMVFSKEEIKSGQYNQNRIKQFGLRSFLELEKEVAVYRGQRLFDLAVFVAQKQEAPAAKPEKEERCIITSTSTTTNQQLQLF